MGVKTMDGLNQLARVTVLIDIKKAPIGAFFAVKNQNQQVAI
jgi:hypothetical protein